VKDTLWKAALLMRGVGMVCESNTLREEDLPRGLEGIFQSLKKYVIYS
jgi:hypothetical protein